MRGSFTTRDGVTLAHERRGAGPLLVCHPGGPGFSARFFDKAAGLDGDLELVLLDPRGTGGSQRPADPKAYAIADYVADLEELRLHIGQGRMNLLGWSHGGVIAMAYAAAYPGRVSKLALVATLARFAAEQESAMIAAMEAKAGEPWYADARAALVAEQAGEFSGDEELGELAFREFPLYFARFGERERAYLERVRETPNADTLHLFNTEIFPTFDLRPNLATIDAPTLVLVGEQDFICGPTCGEELAKAIPGAELVSIPDCGHFLFLEAPDATRRAIVEFLS